MQTWRGSYDPFKEDFCFYTALIHHNISVWLKSGLWLDATLTMAASWFFCFSALAVIQMNTWTEGSMINAVTARCPAPLAEKPAHILTLPPLCLTVALRYLHWHAEFGFHQTCCSTLWPNISTLVFQRPSGLIKKVSLCEKETNKQPDNLFQTDGL